MKLVFLPQVVYGFRRKIFLLLYSITWPKPMARRFICLSMILKNYKLIFFKRKKSFFEIYKNVKLDDQ